ncbi:MAG: hypothetical protein PVI23_12510 [Maricaulaceae bacterium]|jgi:hypothetical protein
MKRPRWLDDPRVFWTVFPILVIIALLRFTDDFWRERLFGSPAPSAEQSAFLRDQIPLAQAWSSECFDEASAPLPYDPAKMQQRTERVTAAATLGDLAAITCLVRDDREYEGGDGDFLAGDDYAWLLFAREIGGDKQRIDEQLRQIEPYLSDLRRRDGEINAERMLRDYRWVIAQGLLDE